MPQVLKANVRENILNSSLMEFYKTGYDKAKIRDIAIKSNVSPGNIYRYFKNKEALFQAIVSPVVDKLDASIKELVVKENKSTKNQRSSYFKDFTRVIIDLVVDYKYEMIIILNNDTVILSDSSNGTIHSYIEKILTSTHNSDSEKPLNKDDLILINALAKSLISGLAIIIEESNSSSSTERILEKFLEYYL